MGGELKDLVESADGALVVVTTVAEGETSGCVVGFHSQSGLTPARYALWISKANHTYRVMIRADHFAVHFLTEDDVDVARHFGTQTEDEVDKFADLGWTPGPGGVPLVDALPHRIVVRKDTMLDPTGDHVGVFGEIVEVHGEGGFTPFRLSAANHWQPGHDAEDRAIDPEGDG